MTTGSIVEDFDVLEDRLLCFVASLEMTPVDQLVLQGVPEALRDSVVVAAPATAHAGNHAVGGQRCAVAIAVNGFDDADRARA